MYSRSGLVLAKPTLALWILGHHHNALFLVFFQKAFNLIPISRLSRMSGQLSPVTYGPSLK